ncbi:MAG: GDP-L-fucose synthase [Alphaproteobacteria bacterium]|nr:GDP-L-fucose synthase [Alphaproteobacteria bacterium]
MRGKRVFVAGHRGMVGSALVRRLVGEDCEVVTAPRSELDLMDQTAVLRWMRENRPDTVIIAAAKVGGILANASYPVDFLQDNLVIQSNLFGAAHDINVSKLLFLGSSCIYPKMAKQPIREESLLTGPLEPTNQWYAIAKIAGIKLCQAYREQYGADYISAMPCNLYGPGDNYDLQASHVMPALIRRFHEAKESKAETMVIWGTGTVLREFLHVDDCAEGLVHLLKHYSGSEHVNLGSGSDITILALAETIARVVGFEGDIKTDPSKPDGTPRKLMDSHFARSLGWQPGIGLEDGIAAAYQSFLDAQSNRGVH